MKNTLFGQYRGFTLVELMIVIAMIAILGTALFSSVGGYYDRARNTQRIADIRNINTAMKAYFIDTLRSIPTNASGAVESGQCLGVGDGAYCWKGYVFNASVATAKGRTGGIIGSTQSDLEVRKYISKIPLDPQPLRNIGDRYIIAGHAGDIHCNGAETIMGGGWILWQPQKIPPTDDKQCLGQGQWGCCSGIGCGTPGFCLMRVDM